MKINKKILEEKLPHGSGIDGNWYIYDMGSYYRCANSYHAMNDGGYYIGWADFTVIIPKSNPEDFKLHFHGDYSQKLNQRFMLRDYLEETIHWSLFGD